METPRESVSNRSNVLTRAGWILLTLLFLGAIVVDAFFSETGILQVWRLERDYKQLRREITELENKNAALERAIEDLRSDPEAIEKVAREQLGFIKPGEDVYLFPAEPAEGRTEGSKRPDAGEDSGPRREP